MTDNQSEFQATSPTDSASSEMNNLGEIELSLDQLSRAYAKVIRGETDSVDPDLSESTVDEADVFANESLDPVALDDRHDDAPCPITESAVLESILFAATARHHPARLGPPPVAG